MVKGSQTVKRDRRPAARSDTASFTTAPPRNFAVLADFGHQGVAPTTHNALKTMVQKGEIDAVLHAGDFAYDFEGEYSTGPFDGRVGDRFMEQVCALPARCSALRVFDLTRVSERERESARRGFVHDTALRACLRCRNLQIGAYAKSVPYFPAPGNHETCHDNYTHYDARFSGAALGPGTTSGSATSHYYSWNSGCARATTQRALFFSHHDVSCRVLYACPSGEVVLCFSFWRLVPGFMPMNRMMNTFSDGAVAHFIAIDTEAYENGTAATKPGAAAHLT